LNLWGCEPFSVFCLSAFLSFARLSTCGTRQNKLSLLSGGAEAGLKMLELAKRHQLTARRMHDARHAALAMVAGVCAVYTYTIPKTGGGLLLRCRLQAGATKIERPDYLVRTIAAQKGKQSDLADKTVALVDSWLERNRLAT